MAKGKKRTGTGEGNQNRLMKFANDTIAIYKYNK